MRRYLTQSFRSDIQDLDVSIDATKYVTLADGRTLRKQTDTDKIHETWDDAWLHLWHRENEHLTSLHDKLEIIKERLYDLHELKIKHQSTAEAANANISLADNTLL